MSKRGATRHRSICLGGIVGGLGGIGKAQERLALAGAEDLGAGVKLAAKSAGGKWDLVGAVLGEARTLELMSSTVRDLPPLLGSMVRKDRLDTVEVRLSY